MSREAMTGSAASGSDQVMRLHTSSANNESLLKGHINSSKVATAHLLTRHKRPPVVPVTQKNIVLNYSLMGMEINNFVRRNTNSLSRLNEHLLNNSSYSKNELKKRANGLIEA
jgi:hypothetical protein